MDRPGILPQQAGGTAESLGSSTVTAGLDAGSDKKLGRSCSCFMQSYAYADQKKSLLSYRGTPTATCLESGGTVVSIKWYFDGLGGSRKGFVFRDL